MKKKVIYKTLVEYGETFSECLAAAVGEILDMGLEPSPIPENLLMFKFKEEAHGSPDFWRQLAAGAVLRRGVRSWLQRRRAKTAAKVLSAAASSDLKGPSIQMLLPRLPSGELENRRGESTAAKSLGAGELQR